jgi:hypothetical protein
MQGLHTLRIEIDLPTLSSLQLPHRLPALRTLDLSASHLDFDWSWLPVLTALTQLRLTSFYSFLPQSAIDAIGQCTQLQSLSGWAAPNPGPGSFARLCTSPALRRLPHLTLELFGAGDEPTSSDEYRVAFGALEQLQSLRVRLARGISMHSVLRPMTLVRTLRSLTSPTDHWLLTTPNRHTSAERICAAG